MEVKSKFDCMDVNEKIRKLTWKIENFSSIGEEELCSEDFTVDGNRWTKALISHELTVETDSDKLKTVEATCDKAAIDNQKTTVTKPEELTTPPPTQSSCRTMAIEPDEDMKTFFSSLESELSNSKTVFSRAEAKEALAKLEEALNMNPVNFYDSGKFSSLKQAFKMVDRLDCSSTTLTIEQKNVLLAMEESLKELAGRAAKAEQDKKHLIEKESIKLILTRNLDSFPFLGLGGNLYKPSKLSTQSLKEPSLRKRKEEQTRNPSLDMCLHN
ncbi:hypothetical protein V6N13_091674 [Hibiscus sabdariffa]